MFTFLHGYLPGTPYWDGLVKTGFIDDTSGVKLIQHADCAPQVSFNCICAKHTPLYEILREAARPFYVDRLQGGAYYYFYPFSTQRIAELRELLGENFLGFQMHEWASNYMQDWVRIEQVMQHTPLPWTGEQIKRALETAFHYPHTYLESQSTDEFAAQRRPRTQSEVLAGLDALYHKRQETAGGYLLPADSMFMAGAIELRHASRHLMPEMGCQIGGTRVQMALTRGLSRGAGKTFGTYYEPWGGDPFSVCYYKTDEENEWGIRDSDEVPFRPGGVNGGSSRALQKRIFFYSYLSGASFLSEEWGMCNTFYDWKEFAITPYGQVKQEFLRFVRENPNVGEPLTPFCLVLPKTLPVFDLGWLYGKTEQWLTLGLSARQHACIKTIAAVCAKLFGNAAPHGGEGHALTNSLYGDWFDFVYEDTPALWERYDYAVDLTGGSAFCAANAAQQSRILQPDNVETLAHTIALLAKKILPCSVEGGVHWLVNRRGEQEWIVALFHNEGVFRSVARGEGQMPQSEARAEISLPEGASLLPLFGGQTLRRTEKGFSLVLQGGELAVLRLRGAANEKA